MTVTTIYFDTSDTLYHNDALKKAHSKQPIYQLAEIKGISFEEAKELFSQTKAELKETLDHVTKVSVMMKLGIPRIEMQEYIAKINAQDFLKPDKKLDRILKSLAQNYQLGIITNVLKKVVLNVLDALNIDQSHFTHFVSVDNTSESKPAPEPFLKAIELANCEPEKCVYVADSLTKDIIPAKKAGMRTILISEEEIEDEHVDQRVSSIYEVEEALRTLSH